MRRLFYVAFLIVPLLMFGLIGCSSSTSSSDDDPNGGNGGLVLGDTSDTEYQSIEGAVGSVGQISGEMLEFIDIMVDTLRNRPGWLAAGPSGAPASDTIDFDSFYVTYHSNTNFWYFYWSSVDTVYDYDSNSVQFVYDIITSEIEDSMRFRQDYQYVQWPDTSRINQVTFGISMVVTSQTGLVDMNVGQRMFIEGDFFGNGPVLMNGDAGYDVSMQFFGCEMGFDMTIDLDSLEFDLGDPSAECPTSGALAMSGTSSILCTNGDSTVSESGSYSITQTFNGSTVDIVADDGTTRWEVTESCTGGSASPAEPLPLRIARAYDKR